MGHSTRQGSWALLALLAAAALVAGSRPPASVAGPARLSVQSPPTAIGPIPGTDCTVFPSENVWNTDISGLPVHPMSDVWMATMEADSTLLHPDFGGSPYGLPFVVVDNSHPTVFIDFFYADDSDPGPYPFGPDIPLEQGSDAHALIVNRDTCVLYELFDADWNGGDPQAGSGAIFDLGSNALRTDGWTSADAAGLSILAGLVRYDEVRAGLINHAIRFTTELTDSSHLWPARHDAGTPPRGAAVAGQAETGLEPEPSTHRRIRLVGQVYPDSGQASCP